MNAKNRFSLQKRAWEHPAAGPPGTAFTLIELLVVIGTITVLAAMLLPALAGARADSKAAQCQNNLRELTRGWIMYSSDYEEVLMSNDTAGGSSWCGSSYMDWGTAGNNTNTAALLDGAMGLYVKSAALFKCPADNYMKPGVTPGPRVRSISMNGVLGNSAGTVQGISPGGRYYYGSGGNLGGARIMSDLAVPGPASVFVIVDEHPDSINSGVFSFDPGYVATGERWRDLPASYHEGGCGISFADGHSEIHPWLEHGQAGPLKRTTYPVLYGNYSGSGAPWAHPMGPSRDYEWMQDRMPYRNF
jgi:prepilin-type processing-associated H-X9-DG protein